jgi:hypothetical protein
MAEAGLLMGPFTGVDLLRPFDPADLQHVHWSSIARQAGGIGTAVLLALLALPLNVAGLGHRGRSQDRRRPRAARRGMGQPPRRRLRRHDGVPGDDLEHARPPDGHGARDRAHGRGRGDAALLAGTTPLLRADADRRRRARVHGVSLPARVADRRVPDAAAPRVRHRRPHRARHRHRRPAARRGGRACCWRCCCSPSLRPGGRRQARAHRRRGAQPDALGRAGAAAPGAGRRRRLVLQLQGFLFFGGAHGLVDRIDTGSTRARRRGRPRVPAGDRHRRHRDRQPHDVGADGWPRRRASRWSSPTCHPPWPASWRRGACPRPRSRPRGRGDPRRGARARRAACAREGGRITTPSRPSPTAWTRSPTTTSSCRTSSATSSASRSRPASGCSTTARARRRAAAAPARRDLHRGGRPGHGAPRRPRRSGVRLETMRGGHIVGAVGFHTGAERTLSVVADEPTTLYRLTRAAWPRSRPAIPPWRPRSTASWCATWPDASPT